MTLGQRLKAARLARSMSLRDVERATANGISNGYLSLLESDEIKNPSPNHLHRLAGVYKIPYAELIVLAGYKLPPAAAISEENVAGLAFSADDLTEEERRDVEKFIAFLRSRR